MEHFFINDPWLGKTQTLLLRCKTGCHYICDQCIWWSAFKHATVIMVCLFDYFDYDNVVKKY